MRSKFLLGLVVMMLLAVPAFAMPLNFTFSGAGDGLYETLGVDFVGDFSFSMIADTANLLSGNMTDILGNTVPVLYYGELGGSLTLNGVTEAIMEQLYVSYNTADGNISFGIWDPSLISAPDIPMVGDIIAVFNIGVYDMMSYVAPTTSGNFALVNGAVTLASSGVFALEIIAGSSPDFPNGSVTWSVPEPSMFLLFGAGMLGFGILRKKF
jgi:hypothetical protein